MYKDKNKPVVAERALASVTTTRRGGRFSAHRKTQDVLRLMRGEDLELLSRELGVVASTQSFWREQFLTACQKALKGEKGKLDICDEQINRLNNKVGELTMENELIQEKAQRLDSGLPLACRRSRQ